MQKLRDINLNSAVTRDDEKSVIYNISKSNNEIELNDHWDGNDPVQSQCIACYT